MKGDPLKTLNKFAKKTLTKPKKTCTKKFLVMGMTQTHVLLLGRPQKSSKYLEAEEATLVWQLMEASI